MIAGIFKTVLPASVVAAAALFAVPAQAAQVEVHVPFSFTVNSETLPPGDYRVSSDAGDGVLFVRGFTGGAFAVTNRVDSSTETDAKLVFNKYGDQYVLREAWMGDGSARELPESSFERGLKEKARNDEAAPGSEQVSIPVL